MNNIQWQECRSKNRTAVLLLTAGRDGPSRAALNRPMEQASQGDTFWVYDVATFANLHMLGTDAM